MRRITIITLLTLLVGVCSCATVKINTSPYIAEMKFENGFRIIKNGDWTIQCIELGKLESASAWEDFAENIRDRSLMVSVKLISSNGDINFTFVDKEDTDLFEVCKKGE